MLKSYISNKYQGVKAYFASYKAPKNDRIAKDRAILGLSTLGMGLSWVMTASTYAMTIPLFYNLFCDLNIYICWGLTIIASLLVSIIVDRTLTMTAPYTASQIVQKNWSIGLFCLALVNVGQMTASFIFSFYGMELALKTVSEHQHNELDEHALQNELDTKLNNKRNEYTVLLADARRDDSSRVENAKHKGHELVTKTKHENKTHSRSVGRQNTYLKRAVTDSTKLVSDALKNRTYNEVHKEMEAALLRIESNHQDYARNRRTQHRKKEERLDSKLEKISTIILYSLAFAALSFFFIHLLLADLRQGRSPNNKQLQKVTKNQNGKVTKSYVTKDDSYKVTKKQVDSPVVDRIRKDEAGKALIKKIQQYVNHMKDETRVKSSIRALHDMLPQCNNFEPGAMEHVLNWLYEMYPDRAEYFDLLR